MLHQNFDGSKIYVHEKHNIPSAAKFGFGQLWVLKFLQLEQFEFFVSACLKTCSEHTLSTSTSILCFEQLKVVVKFSQFKQDVIDLTSIIIILIKSNYKNV